MIANALIIITIINHRNDASTCVISLIVSKRRITFTNFLYCIVCKGSVTQTSSKIIESVWRFAFASVRSRIISKRRVALTRLSCIIELERVQTFT